ncbi:MAG: hypothetical protein ACK53Y_09495, partial [bacterium]
VDTQIKEYNPSSTPIQTFSRSTLLQPDNQTSKITTTNHINPFQHTPFQPTQYQSTPFQPTQYQSTPFQPTQYQSTQAQSTHSQLTPYQYNHPHTSQNPIIY